MNRRSIAVLLLIFCSWATHAPAQSAKVWQLAFLAVGPVPPSVDEPPYNALVAGLKELGYAEGRNLSLRWYFAQPARLEADARAIALSRPDLIITRGTPATQAAHRAAPDTSIVTVIAVDLVAAGLAKTLARPGGQVTGLGNANIDIAGKQLELLREIVPSLRTVGLFVNPGNPGHRGLATEFSRLAASVGISVVAIEVAAEDFDAAFASAVRSRAQAVIVPGDSRFTPQPGLTTGGIKFGIPAIFLARAHAEAGGLISYGPDVAASFRRSASYVDRILRGAKPGDLPIEQPNTFDFAINLRTAKAIGVAIPMHVRLRANAVYE
jgi:putative ABC transport system substrate-binding protein